VVAIEQAPWNRRAGHERAYPWAGKLHTKKHRDSEQAAAQQNDSNLERPGTHFRALRGLVTHRRDQRHVAHSPRNAAFGRS
jgi:hypothetical protein